MRSTRPFFLLALSVAAWFLVSPGVEATSIPVTGTASFESATSYTFKISGPSLSLFSTTVDAPEILSLCSTGPTCILTGTFPAQLNYEGASYVDSSGSLDGISADRLGGTLTFTSSPVTVPGTGSLSNIPITVSGEIGGYLLIPLPGSTCIPSDGTNCQAGPEVFSVDITGSGSLNAVIVGGIAGANFVDLSFTGTATPTPDPAAALLFGSGLVLIFAALMKRRPSHLASRESCHYVL